jgi:hypothetical protein
MKLSKPIITLLAGAVIGVGVLTASTLATSRPAAHTASAPSASTGAASSARSPAPGGTVVTLPSPGQAGTVVTLPPPASAAVAPPPATTAARVTTAPPPAPAPAPTRPSAPAPAPSPAKPSPSPAATTYAPAKATYAGQADDGSPITITVSGGYATAYVSYGYGSDVSLSGTAAHGWLYLTGNDAVLKASYNGTTAAGYMVIGGTRYDFSIPRSGT